MEGQVYDFAVSRIDGTEATLGEFRGRVLLVVNVASACGLTPQYAGLESLYRRYRDRGLTVLGFPANEFGQQEPGTNEEIRRFCTEKYQVDFPMYAKIVVKGEGQHPLYRYLTTICPEVRTLAAGTLRDYLVKHGLSKGEPREILWNFEKFLVSRTGEVAARFAPDVAPDEPMLIEAIEAELAR